jgi:hypothetical protein
MAILVTFYAQGFQIGWMVSPMFAKFKNVVTMRFEIFHRLLAILANALVAFINVLLELDPILYTRTAIPGKTHIRDFIYLEVISQASPYIASPSSTFPRHALAAHTTTGRTLPDPYHKVSPCHTLPCQTLARHSAPYSARQSLTSTNLTPPELTLTTRITHEPQTG